MRISESLVLLMPPKTASRWSQRHVAGSVPDLGNPDLVRHAALHQVPESIWRDRSVVCLTRDPFVWLESWWAHMRRQRFQWSAQWGHDPVPDFERAVLDYTSGWRSRRSEIAVGLAGGLGSGSEPVDHLGLQAGLGCGWWSYLMRWTVSRSIGLEWNDDVRFVWTGPALADDLRLGGFGVGSGPADGVGRYDRPGWTREMVDRVLEFDGPTLELIRAQSVVDRYSGPPPIG